MSPGCRVQSGYRVSQDAGFSQGVVSGYGVSRCGVSGCEVSGCTGFSQAVGCQSGCVGVQSGCRVLSHCGLSAWMCRDSAGVWSVSRLYGVSARVCVGFSQDVWGFSQDMGYQPGCVGCQQAVPGVSQGVGCQPGLCGVWSGCGASAGLCRDQPAVGCQRAVALALSLVWWPWPCVNSALADLEPESGVTLASHLLVM